MHTEYLSSPLASNHQNDITLSALFLCALGLTRIEGGPLGCLSCSWEAGKPLSLKTPLEGGADSVIQPRAVPQLVRRMLFFFLCTAGE